MDTNTLNNEGEKKMTDELSKYQERVAKERAKFDATILWHMHAYQEEGIELPYDPADRYIYATVQNWDDEKAEYIVDEEATVQKLARIAKLARRLGFAVKKDYSANFTLEIKLMDRCVVRYNANREAICTKKVVGTKIVPAYTSPERVEEIVEWDCEKLSLLAVDTDQEA
jgi:hypothetical protein